jgi:molybdopterin adenylyltransferase
MSESSKTHKSKAPRKLAFGIYICSTSRYKQIKKGEKAVSDISGETIESLTVSNGHKVAFKKIILDDKNMITSAVQDALRMADLDVIVFSGGTGITPTDVTIEVVSPYFEKSLPGFGEFFRRISFDKIGSAAVLSRATAGVANGKAIFCIPGSPDAVKTAMELLILSEAPHIVEHARE